MLKLKKKLNVVSSHFEKKKKKQINLYVGILFMIIYIN